MSDLKPCPFCGGEAIILKADQYHQFPNTHYISCRDCTAGIGPLDTEAEAIEAWNRRADDHFRGATKMIEQTAKVVCNETTMGLSFCCGNCGKPVHSEGKYCHHCGAKLDWRDDE